GWMFNYCESLTNVDVSGFDTSNATTLTSMFQQCVCLEYVDVSGFDTSNVTDMAAMFNHCESLTNVDVSGFDTSNVWRMRIMFQRCDVLETLDVSGFDTSNVTDMVNMFYGCYVLTALDVSGFDTSKITNMKGIFGLCNGLTSLDLSGFDMTNCTNWEFFLEQERSLTKMVLPESFKTQGFGTAFPQGSWTCLENGETYSQFKWIDLLRDGGGAGTYIRESYHSLSMNAPLQYMINPVKSYAKFENVADVVCTGDFFYDPVDGRIYASMQDFEHMPDVYTVPGSVTVLMRDIVTDADDNVYDLKCTVDAVTYYGPALLSSRNYTHLNEQILSIGSNGYIYVVFNFFNDDRTFVGSGIVTKKQRITMQVMDKNGTPMEGYFCFGAHDLDNPSLCEIDNGYGGFRGLFSEGVNLVSGFDLDSLNYLAPENFGKICDMGYQPDLYEGYRLTGTANDSNSEASMFVVRASAAGATFDWTAGKDCGTDFAFDYQPEVFKLSKVTPIGNQLPGAKLSLYEVKDNGTENLLENWTSSADKTKNGWLTSGEYYLLKEVEAPAGYRMASDIHFQIDNDNKAHLVTIDPVTGAKTVSPESIDVISMIDEPMVGTVEITKYIKDTTTPLAGAEFSLTGTSSYLGEVSLTGTTDANGKCSFTVPLGGPYTVRETNPPDGYSSAPDQTVTVSTDYQRIALVFEDEPARTLTVKTTTVGGGNTEFPYSVKVTGTDGNPVILPANPAYTVNTTTGEITFRQRDGQSKAILKLPPDATVSIIETSHDGYTVTVKEGVRPLASEDTISVVMDTNRTVEFINNPGILLPNTGGGGSLFYTFGGTALAAFALMYGYSRRRKREGRSTL
ncbi:MAG: BspA family leucine-rich repeat surface protein, partial [Oscillospiraceae bacterium]|nr:BspA family leucine-rich repeat surface protein [Oscillospiraceae bacterium]